MAFLPEDSRKRPIQIEQPREIPVVRLKGCKEIVQLAITKGYWIFDPQSKSWYTPEEFRNRFDHPEYQGYDVFWAHVQIRDPREGIEAGYKRLNDLHCKLEDFTKRVVEYYQQKSR